MTRNEQNAEDPESVISVHYKKFVVIVVVWF